VFFAFVWSEPITGFSENSLLWSFHNF
jgi:hypothetical protein